MAEGIHLYPSRTQKLSPLTPMVLGWRRPGRVGSCQMKSASQDAVYRGVEQLVARRAHNPEVVGSNPAPATKEKPLEIAVFLFYGDYSF